jgi:transcription factor C subunit 6
MAFSPFIGGPATIDHENIVKQYSASPIMLGRGHVLFEPDGPVWVRLYSSNLAQRIYTDDSQFQSVHASDYHPQLALGCSDGTCSTTNTLRSTRRGGSVVCSIHLIDRIVTNSPSIQPFFVHKIYQMDYSRNTDELRMLEQFLPVVVSPSSHMQIQFIDVAF